MSSGPVAPMVSVIVPTYQHAAYIEQCLDGILMQQTTFPVEILLGEDESSDGTREICQRYAEAHPDRIRLLLGSRKDVIRIMGRPTGRANFMRLLNASQGRYIAICEGDDHWIDPLKLQKQVDILEKDASASLVFHNAWVKHEESRRDSFINYGIKKDRFALQEIILTEWFIATASILARSGPLKSAMKGFEFAMSGDMVLQFHAALHGDFVYLDEVCSVYRRHPGGLSDAYWESGGAREEASKHQFEQFRPDQVWLLWMFSRKIEDPVTLAVIQKRIKALLRMSLEYRISVLDQAKPMGLDVLGAWIRERLLEIKPPGGSEEVLGPGTFLGLCIDEVALQTWSTYAEKNLRLASVAGHLRSCMPVLKEMYLSRSYSRQKVLLLGVKCFAWYAKGLFASRSRRQGAGA